jgi:hypothetical protein
MFEATIGLVKAIFHTQAVDPKLCEMIILRAATVLNAPLRMASQHSGGQERGSVVYGDRRGGERQPGGRRRSRICSSVQGDRRIGLKSFNEGCERRSGMGQIPTSWRQRPERAESGPQVAAG